MHGAPLPDQASLHAQLRNAGLKCTPHRTHLLARLARQVRPTSALELAASTGIDTATVYRALDAFEEHGLVRRTDLRHGHADYEYLRDDTHHHHVICTRCGDIEAVASCPALPAAKDVLQHSSKFSTVENHTLEFFGVCRMCDTTSSRV